MRKQLEQFLLFRNKLSCTYSEQDTVLQDYMKLLWQEKYQEGGRVYPKILLVHHHTHCK